MKLRSKWFPIAFALTGLSAASMLPAAAAPAVSQTVAIRGVTAKGWPGPTSGNWSGYAGVTSGSNTVTYASATWTVPSVLKKTGYSSTWVGVDGFNNGSLIQTGTEQDYSAKKFTYRAWWEILPAAETVIPSVTIAPGDTISASVQSTSGTSWLISLTDVTNGQSFSITKTYSGPGTSAEWIMEAPTGPGGVLPLAHYSETEFSNIKLGLNSGTPANLNLIYPGEAIAMVSGRKQISTPSKPTANAFNVAWGKKQPLAP